MAIVIPAPATDTYTSQILALLMGRQREAKTLEEQRRHSKAMESLYVDQNRLLAQKIANLYEVELRKLGLDEKKIDVMTDQFKDQLNLGYAKLETEAGVDATRIASREGIAREQTQAQRDIAGERAQVQREETAEETRRQNKALGAMEESVAAELEQTKARTALVTAQGNIQEWNAKLAEAQYPFKAQQAKEENQRKMLANLEVAKWTTAKQDLMSDVITKGVRPRKDYKDVLASYDWLIEQAKVSGGLTPVTEKHFFMSFESLSGSMQKMFKSDSERLLNFFTTSLYGRSYAQLSDEEKVLVQNVTDSLATKGRIKPTQVPIPLERTYR